MSPFSAVQETPGESIAFSARTAMDLFNESGGQTREREPVPHTVSPPAPQEPGRSTVTTTIARQSAGMMRAVALTNLAIGNLSFLAGRGLASEKELKGGEAAVSSLRKMLQQKGATFREHLKRNATLLDRGVETNRKELNVALAAFRKAEDSETRSELAGRINLLDLNRHRLERLVKDNRALVDFFREAGNKPVKGRRAKIIGRK